MVYISKMLGKIFFDQTSKKNKFKNINLFPFQFVLYIVSLSKKNENYLSVTISNEQITFRTIHLIFIDDLKLKSINREIMIDEAIKNLNKIRL